MGREFGQSSRCEVWLQCATNWRQAMIMCPTSAAVVKSDGGMDPELKLRCVVTAGMLMETQATMNSIPINQNAAIWEHTTVVFGERWSHSHLFRIELYRNSTMRSFLYPWSLPANLSAMVAVLTQWLLEVKVLAFLVEDYLCSMLLPLVAFIANGPDRCRHKCGQRKGQHRLSHSIQVSSCLLHLLFLQCPRFTSQLSCSQT